MKPIRSALSPLAHLQPGARFRRARHKLAIVVTGMYLCNVVAAYANGVLAHGHDGSAWFPFILSALPWSVVMGLVVGPMGTSFLAEVVYATLCFLFCGLNAVVLYAAIAGLSTFVTWALGRSSE